MRVCVVMSARSIVVLITVCDLLIASKYLLGAVGWKLSSITAADNERYSFNFIRDNCLLESCMSQFFFMASICWNLVWVINFTLDLYNPLRSTASMEKWYHMAVWTACVGSTAALYFFKEYGYVAVAQGA